MAPVSCELVGCVGEGIDTSSGVYTSDVEDLLFPSGAFGIELIRHYRSDRTTTGWFGRGWSTVYETTLVKGSDGWVLDAPAGLIPLWSPEAPSEWRIAGSPHVTSLEGGEAEFVWPSGELWTFAADGSLRALTAPYGQLVTITRDGAGTVTLDSSQGVSVDLTMVEGTVTRVRTGDGRDARFNYSAGYLTGVAAPGLDLTYTYNAAGQMVRQVGPSGTTSTEYLSGTVSGQTTSSGLRIALSFGPGAATVSSDHTLTYEHDDDGRLVRIADQDRDILVRQFDAAGRLVESTDYVLPGPTVFRSVSRSYEGDRLASETVDDVRTAFEYDDQGRAIVVKTGTESVLFEYEGESPLPVTVISPERGRDEITTVDGFISSIVDATGASSTTGRDAVGNPVSHSIGGVAWTYVFDSEGNITSTTAPSGREWTATWGHRSKLLTERDPMGRTSDYRYDSLGRLVEQRLPGVPPSTFEYDESGRLRTETSANGLITRYEYDEAGRLAATIVPGDRVWRSVTQLSDSGGTVVTVTAPDGSSTLSQFDSAGREYERQFIGANGSVQETHLQTYVFGLITSTTVVRGASRFESLTGYDELARIIGVTESLDGNAVGTTTYDYEGAHLVRAANGKDATTYEYDAAGRLVKVNTGSDTWQAVYRSGSLHSTAHNDAVTEVRYDIDGRAVALLDGVGTTTQWAYDDADRPLARSIGDSTASFEWSDADRLETYRAPDGNQWRWSYDPLGRLQDAQEPGGVTTSYEYDAFGVSRIQTKGGGHDRDDSFSYDALGRLRTSDTTGGKYEYEYDATGRVTSIDGEGRERWTYDALGQIISIDTGSDTFGLDYDSLGRLDQIAGPDAVLQAAWSSDGLAAVEVTGRDTLRVATDLDGRLIAVKWDDDTAIDLDWSDTGSRLVLRERGTDKAQTYGITDGTLVRFATGKLNVSSTHQANGYLQSLRLQQDDTSGEVRFDQLGRPSTLVTDGSTATIAYDQQGRVSSVLTSKPGADPEQVTVTYSGGDRMIEGDGKLIESLFNKDGGQRNPLPSSLANPLSATSDSTTQADGLSTSDGELLAAPEPHPFADVDASINLATPSVSSPIGVRDLPRLAERMVVAEVARLAPALRISGGVSVRLPLLDPDDGELADFNPFVDEAPSGLALGVLSERGGGGDSLFERAKGTASDIVGGAVDLVVDVARFVIDNPIARLIITSGTWAAASVACGAFLPACVPAAAIAVLFAAADSAQALISAGLTLVRACTGGELAKCGLLAGGVVLAGSVAATTTRAGFSLLRILRAERELTAAVENGTGVALASGRVGSAKSELLATLRWQRVVADERPVCVDQVCARVDLITRTLTGRLRFVEVKNGAGARLTSNQLTVYPVLQSTGAYFPRGILTGGSPAAIGASIVEIQHWGTRLPVRLP